MACCDNRITSNLLYLFTSFDFQHEILLKERNWVDQTYTEKAPKRKRITNLPKMRKILSHNQFFRKSTGFRNTQLYWKWMFCVHENRFSVRSVRIDSTDAVMSKSPFTWNDVCRVCLSEQKTKRSFSHVKLCHKNTCMLCGRKTKVLVNLSGKMKNRLENIYKISREVSV